MIVEGDSAGCLAGSTLVGLPRRIRNQSTLDGGLPSKLLGHLDLPSMKSVNEVHQIPPVAVLEIQRALAGIRIVFVAKESKDS